MARQSSLTFRRSVCSSVVSLFGVATLLVFDLGVVRAEGVVQMGLGQDLLDHQRALAQGYSTDDASASVFVDILSAGEVINVSLCGSVNADDITVEFYAPSDNVTPVSTQNLASSNVDCADPMTAPLTTPMRYTSLETGAYRLVLENTSKTAFGDSFFKRYDITVTPDAATDPDPTATDGRLWGYSFGFNAAGFGEAQSTDANYYALVPGGRPDKSYVWQLDLNNFAGFGYNLMANSLGVDAPNSGYSTEKTGNAVTYKHPMYLSYPAVADPQPTTPPALTGVRFIDSNGQDYAISPGGTAGVQDDGNFEFNTDIAGTYSVLIDLNQDGIYGNAGDRQILGNAVIGFNQVPWDGNDAAGNAPPVGTYYAQVQVHMGEYHFIANDAETSGGTDDGLTIYLANADGSFTDTLVYWDDVTLLPSGSTSNTPTGGLSSTAAGKHTWGNFTGSSFGNERFLDTYVFGLATTAYTAAAIINDDTAQVNFDGSVTAELYSLPGSSFSITVSDVDLNEDPGVVETVNVDVVNDITSESETLTLTETGVATGVFSGVMATTPGAVAGPDNDGVLVTQVGDTITTNYLDLIAADYSAQNRTTLSNIVSDTDADGIPDINDLDDDGDGIADAIEGLADSDGDGAADSLDTDSDNDGILDADEDTNSPVLMGNDADSDGIDDAVDASITGGLDANGDGVDDALQPTDTDGDGTSDHLDIDSDADGIADLIEAGAGVIDTDGDGLADHLDTDSDNDGISDAVEDMKSPTLLGTDGDADGIDDSLDVDFTSGVDANGNGIDDAFEPTDTDGDGSSDHLDVDSDNDGIVDILESTGDSDSDGIADYLDTDSDNDGMLDGLEDTTSPLLSGVDTDNDGIDDVLDADATGGADANSNGIDDAVEPTDSDSDGVPDHRDIDSDNDGLADHSETAGISTLIDTDGDGIYDYLDTDSDNDGLLDAFEDTITPTLTGSDADNDGIDDAIDVNLTAGTDANSNGIDDAFEPTDTDTDGVPDHLDIDSDADGIADLIEAPAGMAVDTDGDSLSDHLDTDSDNDNIADSTEDTLSPALLGTDADNDGVDDAIDVDLSTSTDANSNGVDDDLEPVDTDSDGTPNHLDIDSDADGIADVYETVIDSDGDGVADYLDTDADNDGIPDSVEDATSPTLLGGDADNDGIDDAIDADITAGTDANGNGVDDSFEPTDTDTDGTPNHLDIDSDADGIADIIEAGEIPAIPVDTDTDGTPDYLDTDSDNDGIDDALEDSTSPALLGNDADNDGIDDAVDVDVTGGTDSDANGIDDALEPTDTDNDGTPDNLDTDSDGDSIPDAVEAGATPATPVDTDSDGIPDTLDTDSDNDGIADSVEAGSNPSALQDSDGDGIADTLDSDSDNDGISDVSEGSLDTDSDGTLNYLDIDSDADGIADVYETVIDSDGDGVADYLDTDADNDGIPDSVEDATSPTLLGTDADNDGVDDALDVDITGGADTNTNGIDDALEPTDADNDGTPDHLDTDADGDGIPDAVEAGAIPALPIDTDSDGTPDTLDTDSDNDGIDDSAEGASDTDADGIPDYQDTDTDGDGIPDAVEGSVDTDNDGTQDYLDTDSDNDGISDGMEAGSNPAAPQDSDGDGIPDALDSDSDNDGISDAIEGALDTDSDGLPDSIDPDSDADGIADIIEAGANNAIPVDTDTDGTPDYLDADSDNDGIDDALEDSTSPALLGNDVDNDGIDDAIDVDATGGTDSDGNGIDDALQPGDTDNDGTPDNLDTDSDDDGIPDSVEAGATPATPLDTDKDGTPDHLDLDADGDGIPDAVEGSVDTDGDGVIDAIDTDSDNDGVLDAEEGTRDTDGDGLIDAVDLDADNDGINDDVEGVVDTDGDGIIDSLDIDSDNDGLLDSDETATDSDADGIPNYRDLDSDNDSLTDAYEAEGADANGDGIIDGFADANGDGWDDGIADSPLPVNDFDKDGVFDYLDVDSDNDGLPDLAEANDFAADSDGDGRIDNFIDADADGLDDSVATLPVTADDIDGDGASDHLDLDTDNDGVLDLVEAGGQDTNGDGVVDTLSDVDADGIPDSVDVDQTFGSDADADGIDDSADSDFNPTSVDTDGDGVIDDRDPDIDGDGFANFLSDGSGAPQFSAIPDANGNGTPDIDEPAVAAAMATGVIHTGLEGSGCTIGGSGSRNPLLPLLALASLMALSRRRTIPILALLASTLIGSVAMDASTNVAFAGDESVTPAKTVEATYPAPDFHDENEDRFRRHFYAGFGLGSSQLEPDTSEAEGVELNKSENIGAQLMLGWDMNKWLSLEIHGTELGDVEFSPSGSINYRTFGGSALFYAGRGRHRYKRHGLTGYGRLGYGYLSNHRSADSIEYVKDNATQLIFGFGLEYTGRRGLGIRAEAIYFDADARYGQLSLLYRFGELEDRKSESVIEQRTAPIPVHVAPNAEPRVLDDVADGDGDGVANDDDTCEQSAAGLLVDTNGCALFSGVLDGVTFPSNSAELTDRAKVRLDEVVTTLMMHPSLRFVVTAHTDNQGSATSNMALSKQRVVSVGYFLKDAGIPTSRFELRAFGETRPIAPNDTPEGRRTNRRVELIILQ